MRYDNVLAAAELVAELGRPMTQIPMRAPALPLGCAVHVSPLAWITTARPMIDDGPSRRSRSSDLDWMRKPPDDVQLPMSPSWRLEPVSGQPCGAVVVE